MIRRKVIAIAVVGFLAFSLFPREAVAAIDLRKTTKPSIMRPSDKRVQKYSVIERKKYSTTVKKNKKLEMKKLEKKSKKRGFWGRSKDDGKKSNLNGKQLDTKLGMNSSELVVRNELPLTNATVDRTSKSDTVKIEKVKKKGIVTQGQVNKDSKVRRKDDVPLEVTPAGESN